MIKKADNHSDVGSLLIYFGEDFTSKTWNFSFGECNLCGFKV